MKLETSTGAFLRARIYTSEVVHVFWDTETGTEFVWMADFK